MAASAAKEKKVKIIASACGSGVNFVLGITKVLCGVYTNSIAIISDGVNNFGDVFSSAGAAVGFSLEGKKRSNFPSGLGRTEYAVTLLMAVIIIAVGAVFAWQASDRFFLPPRRYVFVGAVRHNSRNRRGESGHGGRICGGVQEVSFRGDKGACDRQHT